MEDAKKSSENSSTVVDENGEPKVVYHYTGNSFTEFGKGKEIGENTFGNAADAGYAMTTTIGHWFTSNNNQPEYMGEPMELFLDIKAPYNGGRRIFLVRSWTPTGLQIFYFFLLPCSAIVLSTISRSR